jgi:hypothetical protein
MRDMGAKKTRRMGRDARAYVETYHSRTLYAKKLEHIIRDL